MSEERHLHELKVHSQTSQRNSQTNQNKSSSVSLFVLYCYDAMSQTGKVLHLYVEVRSPPEHDGKGETVETAVEQVGPMEALTKFAQVASGCPAPHSSTFRPNVSFILHPSHNSLDSPQRHSIPQQEPFQEVSSGLNNNVDSKQLKHAHSSNSGRTSGPETPCRACSHHKNSKPMHGQRSVVTFSYIEKAHVKTIESPYNGPGGIKEVVACPHKRCSDPVWSRPAESTCNNSPFHQHMGSTFDPIGQAATQRALKEFGSPQLRCKFSHCSDWSPEFHQSHRERCQSWAGPPVPNCSAYRNNPDQGRVGAECCVPKSPASDAFSSHNNQQKSTSRSQGCPKQKLGLKQDCSAPVGQSWGSQGEDRTLSGQRTSLTNTPTHGLNQLSGSNNSSALNSPEIARKIAEEATKVSTIFNEVRSSPPPIVFRGSSNLSSTNYGYPSREIQHESLQKSPVHLAVKMNIPVHEDHSTTNGVPPHLHEAPATKNLDLRDGPVNHSFCSVPVGGDPDSPALPSRRLHPSLSKADLCSPLRDPRQLRADLPVSDSPTLHRHKPPQYTGEEWTSGEPWFLDEEDWDDHVVAESVEISRRLFIGQSVDDSPVSWTSRQQWKEQAKKEEGKFSLSEKLEGNLKSSSPVYRKCDRVEIIERGEEIVSNLVCGANYSPGESVEEMARLTQQQKQAEWRRRQALLLGPVVLEEGERGEDDQRFGDQQGLVGTSPSSSGVTGSLGDRDCISPESSQNSNPSNHPSSGIQVSPCS